MGTIEFCGYELNFEMEFNADEMKNTLNSIISYLLLSQGDKFWHSAHVQEGAIGHIVYQFENKFNFIIKLFENFKINNFQIYDHKVKEHYVYSLYEYEQLLKDFVKLTGG